MNLAILILSIPLALEILVILGVSIWALIRELFFLDY